MARPADPHTRVELLRAAEAIFVTHGLDQAKVEEITARAGRSKGSFYLHFASKEEAFKQIVETHLAHFANSVAQRPVECPFADGDIEEHLRRWLAHDCEIFDYIWKNRGVMRLLLEGGRSAAYGYLIDEFAERTRGAIADGLRRGIAAGFYRADLDVELTSHFVAGAYDRIARQLVRAAERPHLEAWLAEVQRLFLVGAAAPAVGLRMDDSPVKNHPPRPVPGRRAATKGRSR